MRRLNLILLVIALITLALFLKELGWVNVSRYFLEVGYYWPLLLVPYGLVNLFGAFSWRSLFPNKTSRPSLGQLFWLRLSGDSLNQLTPTASIGGELFRIQRLNALGVSWDDATISVVIQKAIFVLSLVLYILTGLSLTALTLDTKGLDLGWLGVATLVLGFAGLTFIAIQRKNPFVSGIHFLEKFGLCPRILKQKETELASLDSSLAGFYRENPRLAFISFLWLFTSWLLHGTEVFIIFRLLGHPIDWSIALSLDALVMLFAALGFMIPGSLGVQDGGAILVSAGFGLGSSLGAAFCIMRRIREAFWLSLGMLVFAFTGKPLIMKQKNSLPDRV